MTQSSDDKAAEEFCSNLPVNLSETVGEERRRIFIAGIEHGKEVGAREMIEVVALECWCFRDLTLEQSKSEIESYMQLWRERKRK